jgi:hypothetical protein
MAATIVQNGVNLMIVGTSKSEILSILNLNHHNVKGMHYETTGAVYHIIAQA